MREVIRFEAPEAEPDVEEVLRHQRLPERSRLSNKVRAALDDALRLESDLSEPVAVFDEVAADEFGAIYDGEGCNAPDSPLAAIFPKADALALYAATLGPELSERIRELIHRHDLAVAYLLDLLASAAADLMADRLGERYLSSLRRRGLLDEEARVLAYSPGYCGWHVSGQGRLFERLRPAEIGVTLGESFLMTPLKSVSGVLVAGRPAVHRFRPDFPFCASCATHECRTRFLSLRAS